MYLTWDGFYVIVVYREQRKVSTQPYNDVYYAEQRYVDIFRLLLLVLTLILNKNLWNHLLCILFKTVKLMSIVKEHVRTEQGSYIWK